ncbi:MAG: hypothetical protein R2874_08565 [Desulfobacterales bacterium]
MLTNRQVQDIITDYAVAEISHPQAHPPGRWTFSMKSYSYNPKMIRLFDITLR